MSTLISWSDEVWNPTTGCDQVSPGCAHCYAKLLASRYRQNPKMQALGIYQRDGGRASGPGFGLTLRPEVLKKPLHWKRGRRIFVNSMSDLFHDEIPSDYIWDVFNVMAQRPEHTFQILTKRIEQALLLLEYLTDLLRIGAPSFMRAHLALAYQFDHGNWPLRNVLIGPTVENLHFAQIRLPILQKIHELGWRTMVSYEPALGLVDFETYVDGIDWLICGAESGPKRRPFNYEWARSAMQQARDTGIPFFFKQGPGAKSENLDGVPADLLVREFPT